MANSTRDKILRNGLALASQAGLEGVTLGVLARQVGMSKSGLFAHFHSKEDVQIRVLDEAAKLGAVHIVEPAMKKPEGLPRLRMLVENWLGWPARSGLPGGCPVAAGLFEYDDIEGPVREKVKAMDANWRAFLAMHVRRAMELGDLRRDLDVEQFVWELCGIYLSHHVATRFVHAPDADRRAKTAFSELLNRAAPTRARSQRSRRVR